MTLITRKDILELIKPQSPICISIYIPTHRAGKEMLEKQDTLVLKNQLKEVQQKLRALQLNEGEIQERISEVQSLINDGNFWRHQSDGLALFLAEKMFKKFTLPVYFEAFNYVSNQFYIKPLMPMFTGNGKYFILTLTQGEVKLYEARRNSIAKIAIDDLIPQQLEDAVGYDFEQKSFQFRSQQKGQAGALFHGHGSGKDDKAIEIDQYFRAIDDGLMKWLHDKKDPLLVVSLDNHYHKYKAINSYNNLMDFNISINPKDLDVPLLHETTWQTMQPYFDKEKEEDIETYKSLRHVGRSISDNKEILKAALDGTIQTLFLKNREDLFGVYNPHSLEDQIELSETHEHNNVSLMNLAASKVFEQNGIVYLLDEAQMPEPISKMNAILKYAK